MRVCVNPIASKYSAFDRAQIGVYITGHRRKNPNNFGECQMDYFVTEVQKKNA